MNHPSFFSFVLVFQIPSSRGNGGFHLERGSEALEKEAVTFLESSPGSLTSGPHSGGVGGGKRPHPHRRGYFCILSCRSLVHSVQLAFHTGKLIFTDGGRDALRLLPVSISGETTSFVCIWHGVPQGSRGAGILGKCLHLLPTAD